MGNYISSQDTVITLWKKRSDDIIAEVKGLAEKFVNKHCYIEKETFTPDVHIIVYAFNEYLQQHMAFLRYEAYMYHTSAFDRYKHIVDGRSDVRISNNVAIGIKLVSWPSSPVT